MSVISNSQYQIFFFPPVIKIPNGITLEDTRVRIHGISQGMWSWMEPSPIFKAYLPDMILGMQNEDHGCGALQRIHILSRLPIRLLFEDHSALSTARACQLTKAHLNHSSSSRSDPDRVIHYAGGDLVAIGSADRKVRIFNVLSMREVPPLLSGHAGSIKALLLDERKGLLLSTSCDLSIR